MKKHGILNAHLSMAIAAMGHSDKLVICDAGFPIPAHAEIIALTQAAAALENWHLNGCTMYVTLEPCPMCAGALVLGRLDRLVYGCDDPKTGACKSLYNIVQDERLNHRLEVTSGVLADECSKLLQDFFQKRRTENSQQ